jgi:hypothetical protein
MFKNHMGKSSTASIWTMSNDSPSNTGINLPSCTIIGASPRAIALVASTVTPWILDKSQGGIGG